jgi:hypothetical protein
VFKACKVGYAFIYEPLSKTFKTFTGYALEHLSPSVQNTPSSDQQKESKNSYKSLKIGTELHVFETERLYEWALKHYNIVVEPPTQQSASPVHVQTAPSSDPHTEDQPKTSFSTIQ